MTVQHVALEVRPERGEECRDFYGLLGFEPVEPPQSLAERALWVQRDGIQLHLLFAEEPVVPREGHVAVVVEDYEATLAALREAGHRPEPRAEHWGSPRAFLRDPAGHRVEVMAFPPG